MLYLTRPEGLRLHVQDVGHGRPVVLLPGFGMTVSVWNSTVALLATRCRVVALDQRGHGCSDKPLSGYSIDDLASDVHFVLDELDLRDVVLVGWSFGGQVAFLATADNPLGRIAKLVLVGSNGVSASRTDRFPFGATADAIQPAVVADELRCAPVARRSTILSGFATPPPDPVIDWLVQCSLNMPTWSAVECYDTMLRTELVDRIPDVTVPVLQIIGSADPVHSSRGALWLTEQLPDATLHTIPECGHYPMLERPDPFHSQLTEFVENAESVVPDSVAPDSTSNDEAFT